MQTEYCIGLLIYGFINWKCFLRRFGTIYNFEKKDAIVESQFFYCMYIQWTSSHAIQERPCYKSHVALVIHRIKFIRTELF